VTVTLTFYRNKPIYLISTSQLEILGYYFVKYPNHMVFIFVLTNYNIKSTMHKLLKLYNNLSVSLNYFNNYFSR
jgi:hypothetical protein